MIAEKIPPRPKKGWTVHNGRGERVGVVAEVRKDNTVVWIDDEYGLRVHSRIRWEDTPAGTYKPR